jgi:hypothetical protein
MQHSMYKPDASSASPRLTVTGQYAAKAKLSASERALLAAGSVRGDVGMVRLCANQAAAVWRVPVWRVQHALHRNGNGRHTHAC